MTVDPDRRLPARPRRSPAGIALILVGLLLGACAHRGSAPRAPGDPTGTPAGPRAVGGADCARTSGYDVLIVGAGLAGLAAGRELARLGHSILILEATDRVGGRGFVGQVKAGVRSATVPIDYGGAWIHGVPTNPLTALVDSMGFERVRSELDAPSYVDGRRATDEEHARFGEAYEAYEAALEAAIPRIQQAEALAECLPETSDVAADYLPSDPAFADVLPLVVASAGPLESSVELASSSAVDAGSFLAGEDDLVDRGMGTFVEEYGRGLPICLGAAVTRIEYSEDGVALDAAGRRYAGTDALVTVSTGVLRAGKIDFSPPLPEWKREAIDRLPMGAMQKVILPFREDVFHDVAPNTWVLAETAVDPAERELAGRAGLGIRDDARRVMAFVIEPLGAPIAIGFYGGEWARLFESQCAGVERTSGRRSAGGCDDPAIDAAVRALSGIYGAELIEGALLDDEVHVTRWSLEPWTLGAYSAAAPGAWDEREVLARPLTAGADGTAGTPRLYFAGEACSRSIYNGSYAGAFETGLAAAREIHAAHLADGE